MSGYDGYSAAYGRVYGMSSYSGGSVSTPGSGGLGSGSLQSGTPNAGYHGVSGLQQLQAAVGNSVVAGSALGKNSYNGLCLTGPGAVDLLHPAMVYPGIAVHLKLNVPALPVTVTNILKLHTWVD